MGQGASGDVEPLETGLWLQEWDKLASRSLIDDQDLERVLRHAFHLVQLAPRPLRHLINCAVSEEQYEIMLEVGAWDSAAISLIGDQLGISVTRLSGTENFTAHVSNLREPAPRRVSDSTFARAVLKAWLKYLTAVDQRQEPSNHQDRHTDPDAPHPPLTRH